MTLLADRSTALAAIYRMGAACCAYSSRGLWSARCDCKYGVAENWPTFGERGNGCPELRSLHKVIEAMTDDEWSMLVARAGGIPSGMFAASTTTMGARLVFALAAVDQAEEQLAELRKLLTLEPDAPTPEDVGDDRAYEPGTEAPRGC